MLDTDLAASSLSQYIDLNVLQPIPRIKGNKIIRINNLVVATRFIKQILHDIFKFFLPVLWEKGVEGSRGRVK
jgi:hypothetical protein